MDAPAQSPSAAQHGEFAVDVFAVDFEGAYRDLQLFSHGCMQETRRYQSQALERTVAYGVDPGLQPSEQRQASGTYLCVRRYLVPPLLISWYNVIV